MALADTLPSVQSTLWGHNALDAHEISGTWTMLDRHSGVFHQPHWLQGADAALAELTNSIDWQAGRRPMYDRMVDVPRLSARVPISAAHQHPTLAQIIDLVATALGVNGPLGPEFEHIGLNLYRDGQDSVAPHRDRLGRFRAWSVVALVSLGGPRTLRFRPWHGGQQRRQAETPERHAFSLGSGDLLVMAGACQRDWEHGIAKIRHGAPRISIGLRTRQFPHGPLFPHRGVTPWSPAQKLECVRGHFGGLL